MEPVWFGKGQALFGQLLRASASRAGVGVVISTGIFQHSGMYEGFARRLASEGFDVLTYDHRGFGQSKSYSDLSRSQVASWLDLDVPSVAGDLADAVDYLGEHTGQRGSVYVWGHSLGGLAGVILATSTRCNARGFILSNPTVHGQFGSPELAAKWEGMNPDTVLFAQEVMDSSCVFRNKRFMEWWKTDPAIAPHYEAGMPFKAAYCAGVFHTIAAVRQRFDAFQSPALVLRGGEDIANHEKHGTADLFRGASPAAPLTFISYPGHGHDVLFDGCSNELTMSAGENLVADDIVHWLRREGVRSE